jgi:excisionase family DNA binding protein
VCKIDQQSKQNLRRTLKRFHQALEEFESALLEFEEALEGEAPGRPPAREEGGQQTELLSVPEVCQQLGMGKSWVYRRIRSGEIPSVKLGRAVKVERKELQEYLGGRRYRPTLDALPEEEE